MPKLEPLFIQYLEEKGNTPKLELIECFHKDKQIPKEKIEMRINKLVEKGHLSINNRVISIPRKKESNFPEELDEIYDNGFIKLGRKNNNVYMQSKEVLKDKFSEIFKDKLPDLKEEILLKFKEIEDTILKNYNPLYILGVVTANNLFCDPEKYSESTFEGKQLYPEIIQNIILKNDFEVYKDKSIQENIPEIEEQLNSVWEKLHQYVMFNSLFNDQLDDIEKEIYFKIVSKFLFLRGTAFPQHFELVARELFSNIDDVLKKKGFSIKDYYKTLNEIENQINQSYKEPIKNVLEEHQIYKKLFETEEKKGTNPEDIIKKYLEESKERREKIHFDIKDVFEIKLNDKINSYLMENMSLNFGDNNKWTWSLDKSDIFIKPIIKVENKYYCYLTPNIIRNVIPIIESILTQDEKDKINYSKIKGDYFEGKTLDLLKIILPKYKIFSNLFYHDGEIDGIITNNKTVLLIEIKGRKKRTIAGREDFLDLAKDDFKSHINEAFEQSKKAIKYINSKEEVEFKDSEKKVVLKLQKKEIKDIFVINVSVEDFSELVTDMNLIKTWDPELLKGKVYPYILTIYDLIVFSELFKTPDKFLDYIKERIEINKRSGMMAFDELDYLGYYEENGSLTKPKGADDFDNILLHGYSEKIERWYSYKRGEIEQAEEPSIR